MKARNIALAGTFAVALTAWLKYHQERSDIITPNEVYTNYQLKYQLGPPRLFMLLLNSSASGETKVYVDTRLGLEWLGLENEYIYNFTTRTRSIHNPAPFIHSKPEKFEDLDPADIRPVANAAVHMIDNELLKDPESVPRNNLRLHLDAVRPFSSWPQEKPSNDPFP